jgi:hypothetical protein
MSCWRTKFGPIFKELWKKLSLSSQKYGFGLLGSGIRKKPLPDPGSRGQKGTGSQIRIRNTAHKFSMKWVNIFHAAGVSSVWYGTIHVYMVLSGYVGQVVPYYIRTLDYHTIHNLQFPSMWSTNGRYFTWPKNYWTKSKWICIAASFLDL